MTERIPRNDYPRPQFQREEWLNLNGEWEFEYDDEEIGEAYGWTTGRSFSRTINVPFAYQSKLSGIGETEFHDHVWYRKLFTLPESYRTKRILLHIGAADYSSRVFVNGQLAVTHIGGHTPFSADVTHLLHRNETENEIVIQVKDDSFDVTLPRGKQYWKEKSEFIFYTRTTGIWQTVWLEPVADTYLERVMLTPNIDTNEIGIRSFVGAWSRKKDLQLNVRISFNGELMVDDVYRLRSAEESRSIRLNVSDFDENGLGRWWTPDNPQLYDLELVLMSEGREVDRVLSYFGMRKISVEEGRVCLNNRPFKMKLILDQGYFEDGLLTPPTDGDIRRDVELTKEMGFNGARKHQKIEDPRYLYWCDRLGLLVWGEMANAYQYSEAYAERMTAEWLEAIKRDYNHPCIVAWVPLNESWGVPDIATSHKQQQHSLSMYHITRAVDDTRLVISNDGWEHTKSDLCTVHDYEYREEKLTERYSSLSNLMKDRPAKRMIYAPGFGHAGEPVVVSEFGGIAFCQSEWEGWGYSGAIDEKDFIERFTAVLRPMLDSSMVQGFCYTQLCDVEQEINGLLTYRREPKVPLSWIRQVLKSDLTEVERNGSESDVVFMKMPF